MSNSRLFVGNLPFSVTEGDLLSLFSNHGEVSDVFIALDPATRRSRGFAFVTMANVEGAQSAISSLDGQDFKGRALKVNEARPKEPRAGGGGGGGGYGGGGGGGGGGERRGDRGQRRESSRRWE